MILRRAPRLVSALGLLGLAALSSACGTSDPLPEAPSGDAGSVPADSGAFPDAGVDADAGADDAGRAPRDGGSVLRPTIVDFMAAPDTIGEGEVATLSWTVENAAAVTIEPGLGARALSGTAMVSPATTTVFTLTARFDEREETAQVTVTVRPPEAPMVTSFVATPTEVVEGQTSTLTWTTRNALFVELDPDGAPGLPLDGQRVVAPTSTTTFTLTASGANGAADLRSVTVVVRRRPPVFVEAQATPPTILRGRGPGALLSWVTRDASSVEIDQGLGVQSAVGSILVTPTSTTTYTLVAVGPGGTATTRVTVVVTIPPPLVLDFSASSPQISLGQPTVLSWSTSDATSVSIDQGIGAVSAAGSLTVLPIVTTTYTLTASGPGGSVSMPLTVVVLPFAGDSCAAPIPVSASASFVGNTLFGVDDYSASNSCTGNASTGPDVVYSVSLQSGQTLNALLVPGPTIWDASIYLVTDCDAVSSTCVAGQDNGNPAEQLGFVAPATGDYYLIVDGFAGAGGPYSLSITIQ